MKILLEILLRKKKKIKKIEKLEARNDLSFLSNC